MPAKSFSEILSIEVFPHPSSSQRLLVYLFWGLTLVLMRALMKVTMIAELGHKHAWVKRDNVMVSALGIITLCLKRVYVLGAFSHKLVVLWCRNKFLEIQ